MNTDEFEEHLRGQPIQGPPPGWRREILAAAGESSRHAGIGRPGPSLTAWLRNWLWPHPVAWGALAGCWLAILALNRSAAPSPAESASARTGAVFASLIMLGAGPDVSVAQEPEPFQPPSRSTQEVPESGCHPAVSLPNNRLS